MTKAIKTNAARLLDQKKIPYELLSYTVDEDNLGAEHVAHELGLPLESGFKTLVLRGTQSGIVVACVPGNTEINLKKLAQLSGNKKVEMVHMKEILELTGYIRGGVSPIGMKKLYPTYVDERILLQDKVFVSAGQRGAQLYLSGEDLMKAIPCTVGDIADEM